MAEQPVVLSKVDADAALKAAEDAAALKKGRQGLHVSAYVDPNSLTQFWVKEDVFKHFGIKLPDYTTSDTQYGTDTTPTPTTPTTGKSTDPTTVYDTKAGSIQYRSQQMVGKAIKIPTGGDSGIYLKRTVKGVAKDIKYVTIRVPSSLSVSAIILWINTCFSEATKRPGTFVMPSGARVTCNRDFTDKTKLPNRK